MKTKQLLAIFLCSTLGWTLGNGLLPVLPVFAAQLKIPSSQIGASLACSYMALVVGIVLASQVVDKVRNKKGLFLIVSLILVPCVAWIGQAHSWLTLTLSTSVTWFLASITLILLNTIAGLGVREEQRGSVFGILATTSALGGLLGGLSLGAVADAYGYPKMFLALSGLVALVLPVGLFMMENEPGEPSPSTKEADPPKSTRETSSASFALPTAFKFLLLASLFAGVGQFVGRLGLSLFMTQANYSSAAISSTLAVGSAIILPAPWVMGRISDRYPRHYLLILCYGVGLLGLFTLSIATSMWHFWGVGVCVSVAGVATIGLGSALTSDFIPKQHIGRGLALFNACKFGGGIVGFATTGLLFQYVGPTATLAWGSFVFLVASGAILLSKKSQHQTLPT
ncbi:MAG: MFS transporter [Deltaproteobacteria bacterium]|nr:MAG: MFS transporter [Deltaproteobacteria bacterium]